MMDSMKDLYDELAITPDTLTSSQITQLEAWIAREVSTDLLKMQEEDNLEKLAAYEKNLEEYFHIKDKAGAQTIEIAAGMGFDKLLASLPTSAAEINNVPNILPIVVANGHLHTLQVLFSKGLKIPAANSTILHTAINLPVIHTEDLKQKKERLFHFLVEQWPDLFFVTKEDGSTIFHTMAENNLAQLISEFSSANPDLAMVANNHGHYPITSAILNRGYESVDALLKINGMATIKDYKKRLPLHWIAQYGDPALLSLCLSRDRSALDAQDSYGQTPLLRACIAPKNELAKALIEAGADVNHLDTFRRSALHYAAINNNCALIETLLNRSSLLINTTDDEGRTPLDYATTERAQVVLIARGAIPTGKKPEDFSNYLDF